jgi:putative nucleotidyltransferase with HDIG domain
MLSNRRSSMMIKASPDTREESFVAGILHDVGRLILFRTDPDMFSAFHSGGSQVTDLDREREFFGVDHQELGAMLAEQWNFPQVLIDVIANHHTPDKAADNQMLVAAVNNADIICHALGIGDSGNYFVNAFYPESWQTLGITDDRLYSVLTRSLDEIRESEKFMQQLRN